MDKIPKKKIILDSFHQQSTMTKLQTAKLIYTRHQEKIKQLCKQIYPVYQQSHMLDLYKKQKLNMYISFYTTLHRGLDNNQLIPPHYVVFYNSD